MVETIKVVVAGCHYSVAVDMSEGDAAGRAAKLLQQTLNRINERKLGNGLATDELLLAGILLADQLIAAKDRHEADLKAASTEANINARQLKALEESTRQAEAIADKLETLLSKDQTGEEEAL